MIVSIPSVSLFDWNIPSEKNAVAMIDKMVVSISSFSSLFKYRNIARGNPDRRSDLHRRRRVSPEVSRRAQAARDKAHNERVTEVRTALFIVLIFVITAYCLDSLAVFLVMMHYRGGNACAELSPSSPPYNMSSSPFDSAAYSIAGADTAAFLTVCPNATAVPPSHTAITEATPIIFPLPKAIFTFYYLELPRHYVSLSEDELLDILEAQAIMPSILISSIGMLALFIFLRANESTPENLLLSGPTSTDKDLTIISAVEKMEERQEAAAFRINALTTICLIPTISALYLCFGWLPNFAMMICVKVLCLFRPTYKMWYISCWCLKLLMFLVFRLGRLPFYCSQMEEEFGTERVCLFCIVVSSAFFFARSLCFCELPSSDTAAHNFGYAICVFLTNFFYTKAPWSMTARITFTTCVFVWGFSSIFLGRFFKVVVRLLPPLSFRDPSSRKMTLWIQNTKLLMFATLCYLKVANEIM